MSSNCFAISVFRLRQTWQATPACQDALAEARDCTELDPIELSQRRFKGHFLPTRLQFISIDPIRRSHRRHELVALPLHCTVFNRGMGNHRHFEPAHFESSFTNKFAMISRRSTVATFNGKGTSGLANDVEYPSFDVYILAMGFFVSGPDNQ